MKRPNFKKYKSVLLKQRVLRYIKFFGGALIFAGIFLAVGTIGRVDYETETGAVNGIMSTKTFAIRSFISLIVEGIGILMTIFSSHLLEFIDAWVDGFERRWVIVDKEL